jgi:hypothetical protein
LSRDPIVLAKLIEDIATGQVVDAGHREIAADARAGLRTMKHLPVNPETEALARRIVWFNSPADALADPIRFMAYVMAHATPDDLTVVRRYVSDMDFREALDKAPPGIIDPRSWAYWNSKMGRYPAPQLPRRRFE